MKVADKKMIRKCASAKGTSEIKKSMKQLPHNINNKKIHLCFQTNKVGQNLSNKAPTPKPCDANLVYKFKCQGCEAIYIGQKRTS